MSIRRFPKVKRSKLLKVSLKKISGSGLNKVRSRSNLPFWLLKKRKFENKQYKNIRNRTIRRIHQLRSNLFYLLLLKKVPFYRLSKYATNLGIRKNKRKFDLIDIYKDKLSGHVCTHLVPKLLGEHYNVTNKMVGIPFLYKKYKPMKRISHRVRVSNWLNKRTFYKIRLRLNALLPFLSKKKIITLRSDKDILFSHIEKRLDVVLFRNHMASSIYSARQKIVHGHVLVNGSKCKKPSYLLKNGDLVQNFLAGGYLRNRKIGHYTLKHYWLLRSLNKSDIIINKRPVLLRNMLYLHYKRLSAGKNLPISNGSFAPYTKTTSSLYDNRLQGILYLGPLPKFKTKANQIMFSN